MPAAAALLSELAQTDNARRYGSPVSRTRLVWKWEDEDDDGEGVGPVWVDTFGEDPTRPEKSEAWDKWVRRSEAASFAEHHGYEFVPDE